MADGSHERYDDAIQQIRHGEQDSEMQDAFESGSQPWQWQGRKAVVVDTNILLSKLDLLDEAARLLAGAVSSDRHGWGFLCGFIIPHQVRLELDSLKRRKVSTGACHRATLWMTSMLTSPSRVVYFQGRHERHRDLRDLVRELKGHDGLRKEIAKGDELILDCVEYFHGRTGGLTSLLTNDRSFANEALGHGIKVISTLDSHNPSARHVISEGFDLHLTPPRTPPLLSTPPLRRGSSLDDSKHAPPGSGSVSPTTPLRKPPSPAPPDVSFPKIASDDLVAWGSPPDFDSLGMAIDVVLAMFLKDRLSLILSPRKGEEPNVMLLDDGGHLSPGDGHRCLSTIDEGWDLGIRPFFSRRCNGDAAGVKTMRTRVRNLSRRLAEPETARWTTLAWTALVEEAGAVLKGSGMLAATEEALVDDTVAGWSTFLFANPIPVTSAVDGMEE